MDGEHLVDPNDPDAKIYAREYASQVIREVVRDSWLSNEQAIRLQALSLASAVFGRDAGETLAVAGMYEKYITDGL